MSKIIKHHIKRSLPLFVIFCLLISSSVFGLVFNFDFGFGGSPDNSAFRPEAQAAGSATTTVEVLNAPPAYIVNGEPKEVPASTSTSPVNVGDALGFAATASDPENNTYHLLICSGGGTAQAHSSNPQCPIGTTEFCHSATTTSGNEATCTYSVADPAPSAETDEWYAYVCDTHATQADCSVSSQGAAPNNYASSSPMYINHVPTFTGLITSDNYKDPGGTFTFRATTSDSDVLGGADGVYLYVCSSNSFSTTTGCTAQTWCTGSATSSTYVECSFATSTVGAGWVTPDGTYSYWGFVRDSHYFGTSSLTNTYTVNNVAPTVSGISLNDDANITLSIKNDTEVEVIASGTIADMNGCSDITSATATIYWSGLGTTTAIGCAANDDNCYPIGTTACTYNGGCGSYPDSSSYYMCTTTLAFHAIPSNAGNSNPYSWTVWMAGLAGFDNNGAYGTNTNNPSAVEVEQSNALDVQESEIQYGQIRGGQNSGWDNATTTVENFGNTPRDAELDVTDMTRVDLAPGYIGAINQQFGTTTFAYGSGVYSIATTSPDQRVYMDIIKPSTGNLTIVDEIYWGIGIPGGTTSGNYEGDNTFTAVIDSSQW